MGNLKREPESLLIAVENNTIKTNHIKARIDKTQQNSRCRLGGDKDETINYIISECSKLAEKEYKPRYEWMRKVIHWELCKNETHNILWEFDIQTDHLISARSLELIIINQKNRTCTSVDFVFLADPSVKLK